MPRSTRLSPSTRARRPGLPLRRRLAPLALAGIATLAFAGRAATPAHAAMDPASYMACVNAVADWTDGCRERASSWVGESACVLAGTAGILGCAIIEAIEQLGGGVSLP